jgi:hypothetical protein
MVLLDAAPDGSGRVILLTDGRHGVFIPDDVLAQAADNPDVLARADGETSRHRYREHRTSCPNWSARPRRALTAETSSGGARRRERQRDRRLALARAQD